MTDRQSPLQGSKNTSGIVARPEAGWVWPADGTCGRCSERVSKGEVHVCRESPFHEEEDCYDCGTCQCDCMAKMAAENERLRAALVKIADPEHTQLRCDDSCGKIAWEALKR